MKSEKNINKAKNLENEKNKLQKKRRGVCADHPFVQGQTDRMKNWIKLDKIE